MDDDGYFDAAVAAWYDLDHGGTDPSAAAQVLAELAGTAPVLEFAIGTGRVALPLSAIGVEVQTVQRLPEGETLLAFAADGQHFGTDEIDVVTQKFTSHHVWTEAGKTRTLSIPMRYVWPSELDLMTHLSGLELVHRWADWQKSQFGPASRAHMSVWRKSQA